MLALLALTAGCDRAAPTADAPEPGGDAASAPAASAAPVDHLAPGELMAGTVDVFGVLLPREMAVTGSFVDVVYARGPAPVHSLAQYFRARLQGGGLHESSATATFDHATVPGRPGMQLFVRVGVVPGGSSVEIRDATPRPGQVLPDDSARWKAVGLTPQGGLADPTHLD